MAGFFQHVTLVFVALPVIKHADSLKEDQVLRVGQRVVIATEISGLPAPEANWSVAGQPLQKNGNVLIDTTSAISNITVTQAERRHAGVYKLSLENLVGKAEAEFTVTVKGETFVED